MAYQRTTSRLASKVLQCSPTFGTQRFQADRLPTNGSVHSSEPLQIIGEDPAEGNSEGDGLTQRVCLEY